MEKHSRNDIEEILKKWYWRYIKKITMYYSKNHKEKRRKKGYWKNIKKITMKKHSKNANEGTFKGDTEETFINDTREILKKWYGRNIKKMILEKEAAVNKQIFLNWVFHYRNQSQKRGKKENRDRKERKDITIIKCNSNKKLL